MPKVIEATIYFDYRCPFTCRLVRLLTGMERARHLQEFKRSGMG